MNQKKLNIGLLLPQSNMYPLVGNDLNTGLRLGVNNQEHMELFMEDIALGVSQELVIEKARKLILQYNTDIVICMVGQHLAEPLAELFNQSKKILFILTLGENLHLYPTFSPYVYYISFELWRSMWAIGAHIGEQPAKNVAVLTSLYDSGYLMPFAFNKGLEHKGGKLVYTHLVSPQTNVETDKHLFLKNFIASGADAIMINCSSKNAIDLWRNYIEFTELENIPLYGSPFSVADYLLTEHSSSVNNTYAGTAWSTALELPQNKQFVDLYTEETDNIPSPFALLGYEAGIFIKTIIENSLGEKLTPKLIAEKIQTAQIISPRGKLIINKQNNYISSTHFLTRVSEMDGQFIQEIIKELNPVEKEQEMEDELKSTIYSGWKNPYMCI
ncbi:MAG: ABC transporter substrate-binding protein [Bacteroidota bacterium]